MTLEALDRLTGGGEAEGLDRAQQLDQSLRGLSTEKSSPALGLA